MKNKGYTPLENLGETLQGSVWMIKKKRNDQKYVVKVIKKSLHKKSITIRNGQKIKISENIVKETSILRYLTSNNPPPSLTKYENFWSDKKHYFLVMEYAGSDFFEFIVKCHDLISKGLLKMEEWHNFCKIAMKQMVDLLEWMHDTMQCCRFDLSLENFVIKNAEILVSDDGTRTISDNFQLKLIDFGLAEVFGSGQYPNNKNDFLSSKYCGKRAYEAPEIYCKKKRFNAKKADIWSLSVCWFMMIIGRQPYNKPIINDRFFALIINGKITELLNEADKMKYINTEIIDLISKLFTMEQYRLNIQQIKQHSFLS